MAASAMIDSDAYSPSMDGEPHWNIDSIVADLRALRQKSLEVRQRSTRPAKMPSRKALVQIVESLSTALFPNRLASRTLTDETADCFVGHTLDITLRELFEQLLLECQFASDENSVIDAQRERAYRITGEFAARLPQIRELIETDIRAAFEGDPAARSPDEVLVCSPGIIAATHHRLAHALHQLGAPLLARMIAELAHSTTGIDIHPGAQIASSFFIDHGTGVVIGETAIIGKRVRLYQAVTLGAQRFHTDQNGVLQKGIDRHPIVEDDVVICAGATLLGRITVGRGSTIGDHVWLTHSVPPGSRITQANVRSDEFASGGGK